MKKLQKYTLDRFITKIEDAVDKIGIDYCGEDYSKQIEVEAEFSNCTAVLTGYIYIAWNRDGEPTTMILSGVKAHRQYESGDPVSLSDKDMVFIEQSFKL